VTVSHNKADEYAVWERVKAIVRKREQDRSKTNTRLMIDYPSAMLNNHGERCVSLDESKFQFKKNWLLIRWDDFKSEGTQIDQGLKAGYGALNRTDAAPGLLGILLACRLKRFDEATEEDMKEGGKLHQMLFGDSKLLWNEKWGCTENCMSSHCCSADANGRIVRQYYDLRNELIEREQKARKARKPISEP
jgi:hypothetical protein